MHNFKSILISQFYIICFFILFSVILFNPYLNSEFNWFQDAFLRKKLAGKINFIIIGASNSLNAFQPTIIDKKLNVCSYNLSQNQMGLKAKQIFLDKELSRNPVKEVIIDFSYETLARDEKKEKAFGDRISFCRFSTWKGRLNYLLFGMGSQDFLYFYNSISMASIEVWLSKFKKIQYYNVNYNEKGFRKRESNDMTANHLDIAEYQDISFNFRSENIQRQKKIISLCLSHKVKPIFVVVPVPISRLKRNENLMKFRENSLQFCQQNNCILWDFNLIKNREKFFNDRESFFDYSHMSEIGSRSFTNLFCEIFQSYKKGKDISIYFYENYEKININ